LWFASKAEQNDVVLRLAPEILRTGETAMNLGAGIGMLAVASILFWFGLPDRNGVHRRFLRFSSAQVLYPPIILAFFALGLALLIRSIAN
jgi:hypothetical protein